MGNTDSAPKPYAAKSYIMTNGKIITQYYDAQTGNNFFAVSGDSNAYADYNTAYNAAATSNDVVTPPVVTGAGVNEVASVRQYLQQHNIDSSQLDDQTIQFRLNQNDHSVETAGAVIAKYDLQQPITNVNSRDIPASDPIPSGTNTTYDIPASDPFPSNTNTAYDIPASSPIPTPSSDPSAAPAVTNPNTQSDLLPGLGVPYESRINGHTYDVYGTDLGPTNGAPVQPSTPSAAQQQWNAQQLKDFNTLGKFNDYLGYASILTSKNPSQAAEQYFIQKEIMKDMSKGMGTSGGMIMGGIGLAMSAYGLYQLFSSGFKLDAQHLIGLASTAIGMISSMMSVLHMSLAAAGPWALAAIALIAILAMLFGGKKVDRAASAAGQAVNSLNASVKEAWFSGLTPLATAVGGIALAGMLNFGPNAPTTQQLGVVNVTTPSGSYSYTSGNQDYVVSVTPEVDSSGKQMVDSQGSYIKHVKVDEVNAFAKSPYVTSDSGPTRYVPFLTPDGRSANPDAIVAFDRQSPKVFTRLASDRNYQSFTSGFRTPMFASHQVTAGNGNGTGTHVITVR